MSAGNRTAPKKPSKPHPGFPLFPHATGRWAKKIRGKMVYFGPWADPDGALTKYLDQKDALHAGLTPRPDTRALKAWELASHFQMTKQALLDNGELSPRTFAEYEVAAELVAKKLGGKYRLVSDVAPDDFARLRSLLAKKWGPHRLAKMIQYVRSIFKHGYDAGLIERPIRFGPAFNRPSKKTIRLHRADQGAKLFTAAEVRKLLDAAGPTMKAMILLGINCGFGNADVGTLPLTALDLDGGWVNYPRPKTGVKRRSPLWPETAEAIRHALAKRPMPKNRDDARLTFITKYGHSWAKATSTNPVTQEMTKLLRTAGFDGRKGMSFYGLRHTFRTIADEAKDQPAADQIMGHEIPGMSSVYRETISDPRLKAVTDHVRGWLFAEAAAPAVA